MKSPTGLLLAFLCLVAPAFAAGDARPFLGSWAFDIPGGGAGWLGIEQMAGEPRIGLLWAGGSVEQARNVSIEGGTLRFVVEAKWTAKDASGKEKSMGFSRTITAKRSGDTLGLVSFFVSTDEPEGKTEMLQAVLMPPPPPAPDLSKVRYGEPIVLFNGKDLSGWRLTDPSHVNGWSAENGLLVNRPIQAEGKSHKQYGNLRTVAEFTDFNLSLETRPTAGSNSGVYLRGIYEVQVLDSYGMAVDAHNMGAIYSRICPSVAAEKPTGEWETLNITLVDRHVTVVLNGRIIIDNQPLLGCTGGALWSDVFRPGPIYLQGDHSQIEYRNLVLKPVVN